MIYRIFFIDGTSGISLLEVSFKEFQNKIKNNPFPGFFKVVNRTIKSVQKLKAKGKNINDITKVLESEDSIYVIFYHPQSRVLFCSISDADDDIKQIKIALHKISHRFWKKHHSDLKLFRETTEKKRFQTFIVDVENLMLGGRIAEVFPKVLVAKNVLEKVLTAGIISEFDLKVALQCDGNNSPLKISRMYPEKNRYEIKEILKKLEQLDIVKL
ncbi:MAG: hypothetical protein ACFE8A_12455 [Candidatus Hodarchaeota archaeon]